MLAYVARRLILAGFTVWAISLLAWFIIQLPEGDLVDEYFEALMQESLSGPAGEERTEAMRKYLGMDQPLIVQYGKWIWALMQGDLGRSFAGSFAGGANTRAEDQPIKPLIGDRLLLTVVLTGFTIVVTWTFAIPVGIYSAVAAALGWRLRLHVHRVLGARRTGLPARPGADVRGFRILRREAWAAYSPATTRTRHERGKGPRSARPSLDSCGRLGRRGPQA